QGKGPDVVEQSATAFLRLDASLTEHQSLTVEALDFPTVTRNHGLSPRRDKAAAFELGARDVFAGATHRWVAGERGVVTIQAGVFAHRTSLTPNGDGPSLLSPEGWKGNWFARATR